MDKAQERHKIRRPEELFDLYGVNYKATEGYADLTDLNKAIYKRFIINIYNATSTENRERLSPRGINFVEEHNYLAKENADDEGFIVTGGKVVVVDKNNQRRLLEEWEDSHYKHLKVLETETELYLRFSYEQNGKKSWLHIIKNGLEWY